MRYDRPPRVPAGPRRSGPCQPVPPTRSPCPGRTSLSSPPTAARAFSPTAEPAHLLLLHPPNAQASRVGIYRCLVRGGVQPSPPPLQGRELRLQEGALWRQPCGRRPPTQSDCRLPAVARAPPATPTACPLRPRLGRGRGAGEGGRHRPSPPQRDSGLALALRGPSGNGIRASETCTPFGLGFLLVETNPEGWSSQRLRDP